MTEERSADLSVINFSVNRLLRGGTLDRDDATQARLDSERQPFGAGDVPEAESVWHKSTAKGLEEADRKMGTEKGKSRTCFKPVLVARMVHHSAITEKAEKWKVER